MQRRDPLEKVMFFAHVLSPSIFTLANWVLEREEDTICQNRDQDEVVERSPSA